MLRAFGFPHFPSPLPFQPTRMHRCNLDANLIFLAGRERLGGPERIPTFTILPSPGGRHFDASEPLLRERRGFVRDLRCLRSGDAEIRGLLVQTVAVGDLRFRRVHEVEPCDDLAPGVSGARNRVAANWVSSSFTREGLKALRGVAPCAT